MRQEFKDFQNNEIGNLLLVLEDKLENTVCFLNKDTFNRIKHYLGEKNNDKRITVQLGNRRTVISTQEIFDSKQVDYYKEKVQFSIDNSIKESKIIINRFTSKETFKDYLENGYILLKEDYFEEERLRYITLLKPFIKIEVADKPIIDLILFEMDGDIIFQKFEIKTSSYRVLKFLSDFGEIGIDSIIRSLEFKQTEQFQKDLQAEKEGRYDEIFSFTHPSLK